MVAERDYSIRQGDDISIPFRAYSVLTDGSTAALDLTGYTHLMKVRTGNTSHSPELLELSSENGAFTDGATVDGVFAPAASGWFTLTIAGSNSDAEWSKGHYDQCWFDSLGKRKTILAGTICIQPSISL
jgi:hypothetical protein